MNEQLTYFAGTNWVVNTIAEVPTDDDISELVDRYSGDFSGLARLAVDAFGAPVSAASPEVKLLVNIMVNENLALSRGALRVILECAGKADLESDHVKFYDLDKNRSGIQKQTTPLKTCFSNSNRSSVHYFLMPYLAQSWNFTSGKKVFGKKLDVVSEDAEIVDFLKVSKDWTAIFKDVIWRNKQLQRSPRAKFFYPDTVVPNTDDWVYSDSGDWVHPTPGFVKEVFSQGIEQEVFPGIPRDLLEATRLLPASSVWQGKDGSQLEAVKTLTAKVLNGSAVKPPKVVPWSEILSKVSGLAG